MIGWGIALIAMGISAGLFGAWALSDDRDWLILIPGYYCYRYWWVLEPIGIGLLLVGLRNRQYESRKLW
jgi:hypothetical protein